MTSLFLFSLILGGGLLAVSLVGDLFGGADADLDTDLDTDFDVDTDLSADAELDVDEVGSSATAQGDVPSDLAGAFRIFTVRNLTYFLFGFGAVGWLLVKTSPDLPMWAIAAAAVLAGGLAAGIATALFGWLKTTDSGWQADEASFVGCEGRVVLPVGHGKIGQIVVRRGDREHELRALPFEPGAAAPERWRHVMVIEMEGGTARVSPTEALAPAGDGLADT